MRKWIRLSQENLADAAGLSAHTIEKIESGRHRPDEQTLRSIARALNLIDIRVFAKPSAEQQANLRADIERASRKMAFAATTIVRAVSDFLNAFGRAEMFRVDRSEGTGDDALAVVSHRWPTTSGSCSIFGASAARWTDCTTPACQTTPKD